MSDESASEGGEWEEWTDSEGGGDAEPARSLFCDTVLSSPEEAMEHDAQNYHFDIRQYAVMERLDEYDIFRCINYVRRCIAEGTDPLPSLQAGSSAAVWRGNDDYLKPFLEDDALLFHDYENVVASWRFVQPAPGNGSVGPLATPNDDELQRLQAENEALKEALSMLAASCLPDDLREEAATTSTAEGGGSAACASVGTSSAAQPQAQPVASSSRRAPLSSAAKEIDGSYFDSYGRFGIHRDMISDKPRTDAYQRALEGNPSLIKDKVVLDVGCGTGILSLFACRAGAARVLSVEGNQRMANFASQVCKANGFSSDTGGPMTVVQGKLEELDSLPVDKVDVLVSEWMGYALLFETMLDSVLYARDRFLKPGGAMLPDIATIYVAGASAAAAGGTFWKDVYGFDMSPIANEVHKGELELANVHVVKPEEIVTDVVKVKELDLCTMAPDEQDFSADFTLTAQGPSNSTTAAEHSCHAIVLWFDTDFSSRHCKDTPVRLSSSVYEPPTHWSQTVLLLKEPVPLAVPGQGCGQPIASPCAPCLNGRVSMVRHKHKHRFLDISLEYSARLSDGKVIKHAAMYSMSVSAD